MKSILHFFEIAVMACSVALNGTKGGKILFSHIRSVL